ncbi:MAG: hypothetical protein WCG98_04935 [bacterium]
MPRSFYYITYQTMKEFPVFAFEVDELKEKLETFNKLRQEISEL